VIAPLSGGNAGEAELLRDLLDPAA
jgi:hypothetical protein